MEQHLKTSRRGQNNFDMCDMDRVRKSVREPELLLKLSDLLVSGCKVVYLSWVSGQRENAIMSKLERFVLSVSKK